MIISFVNKIISWPQWAKILLFSFSTILPVYFSAFLSLYISKIAEIDDYRFYIHIFFLIIVTVIIVLVYKIFLNAYNSIIQEKINKKEIIMYAYSLIERYITSNQEAIYKDKRRFLEPNEILSLSIKNIKILIENIYTLFESKYGRNNELEEKINFEVTFMTKSYKDSYITIPAYSNRPKRAPISMSLREKKPDIYDNTITADIYRETKPHLHIIENTNSSDDEYKELYPEQKSRIKSSIVFPVLSPQNKILATIVVHCDKDSFFKKKDFKFWNNLIEIFSKYIGLEKIKIDFLVKENNFKPF